MFQVEVRRLDIISSSSSVIGCGTPLEEGMTLGEAALVNEATSQRKLRSEGSLRAVGIKLPFLKGVGAVCHRIYSEIYP